MKYYQLVLGLLFCGCAVPEEPQTCDTQSLIFPVEVLENHTVSLAQSFKYDFNQQGLIEPIFLSELSLTLSDGDWAFLNNAELVIQNQTVAVAYNLLNKEPNFELHELPLSVQNDMVAGPVNVMIILNGKDPQVKVIKTNLDICIK